MRMARSSIATGVGGAANRQDASSKDQALKLVFETEYTVALHGRKSCRNTVLG